MGIFGKKKVKQESHALRNLRFRERVDLENGKLSWKELREILNVRSDMTPEKLAEYEKIINGE